MDVQIEESWKKVLLQEFSQPYFLQITSFLRAEKKAGKIIYPPGPLIFNAFNTTPFDKVKIVLLGQDPYHGPGQAHGLSFSVPNGIAQPPSLLIFLKNYIMMLEFRFRKNGNLTIGANTGVLLLNASLTVRANEPMSHAKIGWAQFTDAVIKIVSEQKNNIVFLLWGKFAQEKQMMIDDSKHLILKAAHPSPFSAEQRLFWLPSFFKSK